IFLAMSDRAEINPVVLRWARETAKYSIDEAASKISVSPEKLMAWESGETMPTIRQAQHLAKTYRRPFAILFLSEIPKDFQPLRDFRAIGSAPLSTGSTFIIREIQQKQAWMSEINQDEGESPAPFIGRFSISDDPTTVSHDILQTLSITPGNYASNPMSEWIDHAESNGIFISRTSFVHPRLKLDAKEFQGFAIADPFAPFIFINSDDYDAPQLFTLVHELAHLWIDASGISNQTEPSMETSSRLDP